MSRAGGWIALAAAVAACGAPPATVTPPTAPAARAERPLEEPLLLVGDLGTVTWIGTDGVHVFVVEEAGIWRVKRDGSEKRTALAEAIGIVEDATMDADFVYYATDDDGGQRILRVRKDGRGKPEVVVAELRSLGPLAVDDTSLYYGTGTEIRRIRKDASAPPVTLAPQAQPEDLLVVGDALWWTTADHGTIKAVPVAGGAETEVVGNLSLPFRLAGDATHVYWTDPVAGNIGRVPRAGGAAQIVVTVPDPHDVAVDDRFVYWSDSDSGTISRIPRDGGQPFTLFWNLQRPTRLLVDEEGVTYVHADFGVLIRRPKGQKNIKRAISK